MRTVTTTTEKWVLDKYERLSTEESYELILSLLFAWQIRKTHPENPMLHPFSVLTDFAGKKKTSFEEKQHDQKTPKLLRVQHTYHFTNHYFKQSQLVIQQ